MQVIQSKGGTLIGPILRYDSQQGTLIEGILKGEVNQINYTSCETHVGY